MLEKIIAWSLHNRGMVLALSLVIAVLGTLQALRMPIDVLPDLNRPVVSVLTEAPGLVPQDVETLVTWPIEQVVNGASGVFRVRSTSSTGLSVVHVEFEWGTDILIDRQIVNERLQLARERLPEGVQPVMAPMSSIMGQVQLVGFRSESGKTGPIALRRLIERDVVPRLRSISGIAQLVVMGGQPTELQVVVDAAKLRAHGVTLNAVEAAVRDANVNVAGSVLPMGNSGPMVSVPGRLRGEDELASAVVEPGRDGKRPVRIADVADVQLGPSLLRTGEAGIDGGPGVVLVVSKQPGVDTVALTDRVNGELALIGKELPADVKVIPELFQQAAFIHRAIDNVAEAVRDGGVLVLVVLFLFLLNLRTTLITLTAIPLSVAITALVFAAFGLSINTMTLGGLAVAIGSLVDDAIVDVENVFRRLHQNAQRAVPEPALLVVFRASGEIRKPVLYGTLLVTVVYLPLFFLSGIEGRLFVPIALAYIVSVFASLVVAMTITPVLCYQLLGKRAAASQEYGGRLVRGLQSGARWCADASVAQLGPILGFWVAVSICALLVLGNTGTAFLPEFNEGSAQVNIMLPPDTSLATSDQFGLRLEKMLTAVDGVQHVARRTGRAEGDEHIMPVSVSEAVVTFDPATKRSRETILEDIRHQLQHEFPGVATETEQPLAHLLSHLLSGVTSQVAIKISGPELPVLRQLAAQAEAAVQPIAGVRDLFAEPQVLVDQIEVKPRREALARAGASVADVARTVELALGGAVVSQLQLGQLTHPIRVLLAAPDRADLHDLAGLLVRGGQGTVRLGDVADVRLTKTPHDINRENGQRRIVVQHNVAGRALGDVVADVERALAPVREQLAALPGYSLRIAGQFEAQQAASRVIFGLSIVAALLMVMILYLHFHSWTLALLVLLSRPLAMVGAVAWLWATHQVLSVATLVGFIALLGMATRNAILLVDHVVHLMHEEGEEFSLAMLRRAAAERVVPVLMTALTSGIGLVPLVLAADAPGKELLYPVATVILGGLITNTLLDLLVTPGLLWWFGGNACRTAVEQRSAKHDPEAEGTLRHDQELDDAGAAPA